MSIIPRVSFKWKYCLIYNHKINKNHFISGKKIYILPIKDKYIVARNDGDLMLAGDQSISRQHAFIHINANGVAVEDTSSKYGTFINDDCEKNKPIPKNQVIQLKAGDIVRFGLLNNVWRLERIPIKICTSTLSQSQKMDLQQFVRLINGEMVDVWDESCTHLTMLAITTTVKVLQSLAHGIPIVTPAYWNVYIQIAQENKVNLPDVNDFIPPIEEPYVQKEPGLFKINLNRQRLFAGKTFAFFSRRHMDRYKSVIELAGGECICLSESRIRKTALVKDNMIAVQYTPLGETQCTQDMSDLTDYITKHNKRCIVEPEIGLALIYSSCEKFCNPKHKVGEHFLKESMSLSVGKVLAEETPAASKVAAPIPSTSKEPEVMESIDLLDDEENNNVNQIQEKNVEREKVLQGNKDDKRKQSRDNDLKRKMPPPKGTFNKRTRKNQKEQPIQLPDDIPYVSSDTHQIIPSQNTSAEIASSQKLSPSVSLPPRSQRTSNFLCTQKLKPLNVNESQLLESQQQPIPPGMGRKRVLDLLQSNSDDESDNRNLFQFGKAPASKKAKQTNTSSRGRTGDDDNDDDDNEDGLFNFSGFRSNHRPQQTQPNRSAADSSTNKTNESIVQIQRNLETRLNITDVQPVKRSQTGWIKCRVKEETSITEEEANRPESGTVTIKPEPEEWELTEEEKKRKWEKSVQKAFEVRTVQVKFRTRAVDEPDHASRSTNTSNGGPNFKAFVKVRNKSFFFVKIV